MEINPRICTVHHGLEQDNDGYTCTRQCDDEPCAYRGKRTIDKLREEMKREEIYRSILKPFWLR